MGVFDFFRNMNRSNVADEGRPVIQETADKKADKIVVGAGPDNDKDAHLIQSFDNSNITYNGSLTGFDYQSILKDKQRNIVNLYKLADYYSDADPIIHGIIRHVYVPYSTCSPWVLTGAKEKTCKMYEEQYKKMRLKEKLDGIMLEFWKYGNVFCYFHEGQLITLPVHKCRIGNVALNGKPMVDYDCMSILNEFKAKSYDVKENWIKDNKLESVFEGYPKEIVEALNKGHQYAQLDPNNTYVLQGSKESWQRYAVPFIASCLSALAKKELISQYEDSSLNVLTRSFVHVKYGDEKKGADMLPDGQQLREVRGIFSKAMSGFPLAVTNQLAEAKIVQADADDLFQWDKYKDVNNSILSAGGISGILVSGVSEDGSTFASAQVSMQTADARIEAARDEFCEMMNRINERLVEELQRTYKNNLKEIPRFSFMPLDMSGKKALREACMDLWEKGLISTKTALEMQGYSMDIEKLNREREKKDGTDEILMNRDAAPAAQPESDGEGAGRKELDNDERHSDPDAAQRGKQPKPSNPDGSMNE